MLFKACPLFCCNLDVLYDEILNLYGVGPQKESYFNFSNCCMTMWESTCCTQF